jgi:hypothetical protein
MRGIKDYLIITRITIAGLREVGAYPEPAALAERLQRFLETEATEAEPTDPERERARKIRGFGKALADIGIDWTARFATYLVKPG